MEESRRKWGRLKKKKGTITEKRAKRPKEELHQLTDGIAFVIHLRYSLNPRLISNCSSFLSEIFFSFSFERKKRKDFVYFYYFFFICCCCCCKKKIWFRIGSTIFRFCLAVLHTTGRRRPPLDSLPSRYLFFLSVLQGKGGKTSIKKMNDMFDAIDGQKEKNPDRRTKDKKKRAQAKKRRIMATTDETHSKLMIHYTAWRLLPRLEIYWAFPPFNQVMLNTFEMLSRD